MSDFEKLGAFYLGRPHDLASRTTAEAPLLYDARDLVTHAACIGMTGSGKTGLCIGLIEEALLDGIPALIIDPKGDLANLMLTFPDLSAAEFRPWVNEDDARRAGLDADTHAAREADKWRTGLARWGQDASRIAALRRAAEVAIYTPGSTAGLPINVLASFAAPPDGMLDDAELLRDRLTTTAASLLGLIGLAGDPLQSREHILIATLLERAWREGRPLDLVGLIHDIQSPPVTRIGALDLEAFYPGKERFTLAMALNNLLAAPGFDVWMQGEALDVGRLLRTADGRPRAAIMSIAHLSDAERMFFVALLLNQVIGWMRTQSGTTSLRAIVYMDEVAGYLPPVAMPPSKAPLLLLLKQARAFGVGLVLATQNPVDLDYKALGNIGTWFIGRLQTERDKARLLDGLLGSEAGGAMDRAALDATLSGLGNRVFLMHNVHEDAPVTFETRWALSYLRGPLTRTQIRQLMAPAADVATMSAPAAAAPPAAPAESALPPAGTATATAPPILPHGLRQYFLPADAGRSVLAYHPVIYGAATVPIVDARRQVDTVVRVQRLAALPEGAGGPTWDESDETPVAPADLAGHPAEPAQFAPLPATATAPRQHEAWSRSFTAWLATSQALTLQVDPLSGLVQQPDESDGEFRVRARQRRHELRDAAVDKTRDRFASRLATQQDRVRRAEQAIAREEADVQQSGLQAAVTTITGLAGAFFGRKLGSATNVGRLGTAARSAGKTMRARQDVVRARQTHEAEVAKLRQMEADLEQALAEVGEMHAEPATFDTATIKPRKSGIRIELVALAWLP